MKHLKTFEENKKYNGKFWLVTTKSPEFEISLWKLDVPEIIQEIRFLDNKSLKNNDKIFISISDRSYKDGNEKFGWMPTKDIKKSMDFYQSYEDYEYMGELEITDEDIEKFKLSKVVNKYNL